MSQRARHRTHRAASQSSHAHANSAPRVCEPIERLLLDQIVQGELDEHLIAIADAVHARLDLLETVNSAKALAMLNIGDRVRFNDRTRPKYLRGVEGVVIELDPRSATVSISDPLGRFGSGQIRRCPPLALERLNPAA